MRLIVFLCQLCVFFIFLPQLTIASDQSQKNPIISVKVEKSISSICSQAKLVVDTDLNRDMREYLKQQKIPFSTILQEDFNGDKLKDLSLLVKCKEKGREFEKLVVLLQKQTGDYNVFVIEKFPKFLDYVYISLVQPGVVHEWDSPQKVFLKYPGIDRTYDEKSSGIYYWDKNKFQYMQTSD